MKSHHHMRHIDPEGTVNISSRAREATSVGQLLSNLAPAPFVLDETQYASREGFWQSLYFSEGSVERARVARLSGKEAKAAGIDKPKGITSIQYRGHSISIGSPEHHGLMARAIRACIDQNPHLQVALMSTDNNILTHILRAEDGSIEPDSITLPASVFTRILMDIREELR